LTPGGVIVLLPGELSLRMCLRIGRYLIFYSNNMDENISKSMIQISAIIRLTTNEFDIIKLFLEKAYIQGEKDGAIKAYDTIKNSFTK
jgi:hypothetical protein